MFTFSSSCDFRMAFCSHVVFAAHDSFFGSITFVHFELCSSLLDVNVILRRFVMGFYFSTWMMVVSPNLQIDFHAGCLYGARRRPCLVACALLEVGSVSNPHNVTSELGAGSIAASLPRGRVTNKQKKIT